MFLHCICSNELHVAMFRTTLGLVHFCAVLKIVKQFTSPGKLYKGSDLEAAAKFLLLFYQEQPVDWLYS